MDQKDVTEIVSLDRRLEINDKIGFRNDARNRIYSRIRENVLIGFISTT